MMGGERSVISRQKEVVQAFFSFFFFSFSYNYFWFGVSKEMYI